MRLAPALFLGLGLLLGPSVASAGKRVDWSDYIESPSERARTAQTANVVRSEEPAAEPTSKRSKVAKKSTKAKRAAKARAKKKRSRKK